MRLTAFTPFVVLSQNSLKIIQQPTISNDFDFTKKNFFSLFQLDTENEDIKLLLQLKREQTVKDLTQKLSNLPLSPQEEKPSRIGDMSGLISKAKEELEKSRNKGDVKATVENDLKKPEPKKSEIELHWEELVKNMDRDLMLCDLDFRDLTEEDEINVLMPRGLCGSSIPPPPPSFVPPPFRANGQSDLNGNDSNEKTLKKTKKTVSRWILF